MAFQAVPDGVQITFIGVQNGIPIVNVVNGVFTTPASLEDLETIADACIAWADTNFTALMHSSYSLSTVRVRDLSSPTALQVEIAPSTPIVGGNSGAAAAANAAVCASLRTGVTGRSFRGRFFWGALPNSFLDDAQEILTSVASDYADAMVDLIDALEAVGVVMGVLSRVSAGVARVTGIITEIIQVIVNTKIDSQRKRTAN